MENELDVTPDPVKDTDTFDPAEHEQSEEAALRDARALFDKIDGGEKAAATKSTSDVGARPAARDDSVVLSDGTEDGARYEQSYRALRRVKVPTSVLEGLTKEQIVNWGKDLVPVQDEVDRAFSDRETLRRQLAEAEAGAAHETDEGDPDQGVPSFDVTLDEKAVTPVMQALGLEGADGAKAVQMLTKLIVGAVGGKVGEALKGRSKEFRDLQDTLIDVAGHVARQELGKRFPALLEDSESWGKVRKKASAFVKSGEYQQAEDAWYDAARLVVGEPKAGSSENGSQAARQQRSNDLPSTRSANGGVKPKALSRLAADRISYNWLEKHPGDVAGSRAAVERARQLSSS